VITLDWVENYVRKKTQENKHIVLFVIKKDMITKIIDENSISCVPEDSDDLIILRRVIKKGDKIIGETVRVVKQE